MRGCVEVSAILSLTGQTGHVRFSDKQLAQTMVELIVALRAIVESYKSSTTLTDCCYTYTSKPSNLLVCRSIRYTNNTYTSEYRRSIVLPLTCIQTDRSVTSCVRIVKGNEEEEEEEVYWLCC